MASKDELQNALKAKYDINKNISQALSKDECQKLLILLSSEPSAARLVKSFVEKNSSLGKNNVFFGRMRNQAEKRLETLILTYTKQEPQSREVIQEMLEALSVKTAKNPRLKSLRKTGNLLSWMFLYIENLSPIIQEDPKYKEYPVRAWHDSDCYHLPKGCTHYPRIEKNHGQHRRIRFFKTPADARASNLRLCGTCRRILK